MTQNAKENIVELNWNQFLYGENTDKREKFLKELAASAPIQTSVNAPMAIYIPTTEFINGYQEYNSDLGRLKIMAREQMGFTILELILKEIFRTLPEEVIADFEPNLIDYINTNFLNHQKEPLKSLKELLEAVTASKEFYKRNFENDVRGQEIENIDTLRIMFIEPQEIVVQLKKVLKNNSNFVIIIDHNSPLCMYSIEAINTLIGMRLLSDMSIKVATGSTDWGDYRCLDNTQFIETTHDYMAVNLDKMLEEQEEKKQEFTSYACELGGFAQYRDDIDGDETEFQAFNYCLALDYLSALWEENFEALGEISANLLSEVSDWLNYDGEIGKDQIDIIEKIPRGEFLTCNHRTFADATIAHKSSETARALIYNGNSNINLFLTVILYSNLFLQDEDDILNLIPCNTKEEYENALRTIFQGISTYYGSLKTPEEKEKFLLQIRPAIIGIRIPKQYKDDKGIQELIDQNAGGWQMRLKEISNN